MGIIWGENSFISQWKILRHGKSFLQEALKWCVTSRRMQVKGRKVFNKKVSCSKSALGLLIEIAKKLLACFYILWHHWTILPTVEASKVQEESDDSIFQRFPSLIHFIKRFFPKRIKLFIFNFEHNLNNWVASTKANFVESIKNWMSNFATFPRFSFPFLSILQHVGLRLTRILLTNFFETSLYD